MRIIVGISGASGVILGYRVLQQLKKEKDVEVHLILTESAKLNFKFETNIDIGEVLKLADYSYDNQNLAAKISSGSFVTDGMIIVPCSMKSLAAIACGFSENLLVRAVDVCLKEGRKVIVCPREMPFNRIHLKNMLTLGELGCAIIPPMLTFYNNSKTLEEQMNHVVGKILLQFNILSEKFKPWEGENGKNKME